jgi:hypothetical protein
VFEAASVDHPDTWLPLVRRLAQRYAAPRLQADVTAESLLAIVVRLRSGRTIERLPAFACPPSRIDHAV